MLITSFNEAIAALRPLVAAPGRIAVITHHNPDGDAMGSSLGWAAVLKAAGHDVQVVLPNTPPSFLQWMPGFKEAIAYDRSPEACIDALRKADVVFALDFNQRARVRDLEPALREARAVVLIDHHQGPEPFATIAFSDTSACSTCQMVFDVVTALGWDTHLAADAATCLYTGVMTDTGSFRFNSVTPHTFRVAAKLMDRGVKVDAVYDRVMDDNTEHRLRLLGFALSERMEVLHEQGAAIFRLAAEDMRRYRHQPGDTEGLVNYGLSIRGIRISAFFMEHADGIKISLRSRGDLPVDTLAREHFEGGGHTNAAGGRSKGTMEETIARFKRLLPDHLARYPA